MNKDSNIAVIGASGLVGSSILEQLKIRGYSNIIGTYRSKIPISGVRYEELDCTNQSKVEEFFKREKIEFVFLAAAKVGGILANNTFKAEFIRDNLLIALTVIDSAYRYGVKKLLNLGSSCIYPKHCPQPMKEEYLLTAPLESTNEPYAVAKIAAIKLCRYYNEQYGTNYISLMPTNLHGPRDNFDLFSSHVLSAFIRKFHLARSLEEYNWKAIREDLNKRPIEEIDGSATNEEILKILDKYGVAYSSSRVSVTIWGSGEVYREFLHVDDLADACVFIMENIGADEIKNLSSDFFVNVGAGNDIKIKELAKLVKNIIGFNGDISYDLSKPDGTPRKLLDISKIKALGWQSKIGLKEGINKTYKWYVGH